jgi:tripartite-type tricarboxylate transporter receptor subunit TctC
MFEDLMPVSLAAYTVDALAVGPLVPASVRSLGDFLKWCKANPAQANFGSPGAGSILHFIGALLAKGAGVELRHVQYRGSQPAVADMLGGQIAAVSVPIGDMMRHMDGGRARVLATTGRTRSRFAPDVPTFAEQGFKSLVVEQWMAFFMPARTPEALIVQTSEALRDALASRSVSDAFAVFGMEPASSTPAELAKLLRTDYERWGAVVKETGFKFD